VLGLFSSFQNHFTVGHASRHCTATCQNHVTWYGVELASYSILSFFPFPVLIIYFVPSPHTFCPLFFSFFVSLFLSLKVVLKGQCDTPADELLSSHWWNYKWTNEYTHAPWSSFFILRHNYPLVSKSHFWPLIVCVVRMFVCPPVILETVVKLQ